MNKINKKQLYENVKKVRESLLQLGFKYPLNIFDICNQFDNLDIKAVPFKSKGLRGMAMLAEDDDDLNCILVNSNISNEEQNFHGFHELMHIVFENNKKGQSFTCYEKVMPFQDSYTEWIANEGAAELILPHDMLLPCIKEKINDFETNLFGVYDMSEYIAKLYGVSSVVVRNRINSLKYEIYQYLRGSSISDIRILSKYQQEKEGIFVDSLNDIEDNRLTEYVNSESPIIRKTFFQYSKSYRNLAI